MERISNLVTLTLFVGVIFIVIGDRFLPEPLGSLSTETRSNINQTLMDLFPKKEPINLYEKTDKLIKEAEEEQR